MPLIGHIEYNLLYDRQKWHRVLPATWPLSLVTRI